MKKLINVTLLCLLVACRVSAQNANVARNITIDQAPSINFFRGTWAQAVALSVKENKMIFVDCNTSWCGPCKRLAKDVFTQKKVYDFYNANFINVSMDMEKGDGPALAKTFGIKAYPTLAYLKPGGYTVMNTVGFTTADSMLINGKLAISKIGLVTIDEQFFKKPRTAESVKKYFVNLRTHGLPGSQFAPIDSIIKQEGIETFYQKKYWEIIPIAGTESKLGLWFVKNREKFAKIYGEETVNQRIAEMYCNRNKLIQLTHQKNGAFDDYKKLMAERNLPNLDFINAQIDFFLASKTDLDKAFRIADKALVNAKPWQYFQMARWADFNTVGANGYRMRAAKWAAKAAVETKDKSLQQDALIVVDDLMNCLIPTAYPAPKMYGLYV